MKKKLFVGVFALTLISLNVSICRNVTYNENENDTTLKNITVLQSSAKESKCDKTTKNPCEIEHFPPSTGVLTVYE